NAHRPRLASQSGPVRIPIGYAPPEIKYATSFPCARPLYCLRLPFVRPTRVAARIGASLAASGDGRSRRPATRGTKGEAGTDRGGGYGPHSVGVGAHSP